LNGNLSKEKRLSLSESLKNTLRTLHHVAQLDGTSFLYYIKAHMDYALCPVEQPFYGLRNTHSTDYGSLHLFTNWTSRTNYNYLLHLTCVTRFSLSMRTLQSCWLQYDATSFSTILRRLHDGLKPWT